MAIHRATVTLNRLSGLSEDAVQNVWHFRSGAATTTAPALIAGRLIDFYNAIGQYIGNSISRLPLACSVVVATVIEGGAGQGDDVVTPPVATVPFNIPAIATGASSLPAEVAAALSFRGDYGIDAEETGSTRPRSRKRGRIYLGPLSAAALGTTTSPGEVVFSTTFMDAILDAYIAEIDLTVRESVPGDGQPIRHVVYSPTSGLTHGVEAVWMDNAPDIIRSRGVAATGRDLRLTTALEPIGDGSDF